MIIMDTDRCECTRFTEELLVVVQTVQTVHFHGLNECKCEFECECKLYKNKSILHQLLIA